MNPAIARSISSNVGPRGQRIASRKTRYAFTLVELLIVVSVIALLLALLLPALGAARERGRQTVCMAHLRSIGQAIIIYADDNQGGLPPGDCSVPWMVWAKPDECGSLEAMTAREVNLGYVLKAGILPMPASYDSVLFCPSSRTAYPLATPDAFRQWWGSDFYACITYMYNEALDGFAGEAPSGKEVLLAHENAINFVRADGSVDTLHPGRLVIDKRHGAEGLAEVITRYGTSFPAPVVFRWLEEGAIDVAQAQEYLKDPLTWCQECGQRRPHRLVQLAEVGSKPLVCDIVGHPKYG